jgi:DNA-binding response OmpR family regulator
MIDTLVSRLRRRLAELDADHYVVTRRGFGLMFSRGT